jgi:anti-sigma factor RsiW
MSELPIIRDDELHAYVDGALTPERQRDVEAFLAANPEAAARVADYARINDGLRRLYDANLSSETAAAALPVRRPARRVWRAAAVAAWVTLGTLAGWLLRGTTEVVSPSASLNTNLVKPAAFAHYVYSAEVKHPVEVGAAQEEHLVAWLSKRLNTTLRAPNLATHGFQLVGGRLLPSTDRMAAQFMYQDEAGQRITLYARRGAWENETTAFRYNEENRVGTFYWVDGPMGYALSGEIERARLLQLSETVYRQLNP